MIFPHRVTHKRPVSTFTDDGIEVAAAAVLVEEHVPALISPSATSVIGTPFGRLETQEDLVFVEAMDEVGELRRVQTRDLLIDEDTGDVWVAVAPGNTFQAPTTFSSPKPKYHHIEVRVARADVENIALG